MQRMISIDEAVGERLVNLAMVGEQGRAIGALFAKMGSYPRDGLKYCDDAKTKKVIVKGVHVGDALAVGVRSRGFRITSQNTRTNITALFFIDPNDGAELKFLVEDDSFKALLKAWRQLKHFASQQTIPFAA
jgi:hypothetical protein